MAGQIVSFPGNGQPAEGYLATPASGSGPGVIVIQEWWGLVPWIKSIADRLAGEGYVALTPDLYHGKTTDEPDEAGKLMMGMKMEQAAKEMSGAYDYLKTHDNSTGKVACVGFCMGGGLSLYLATLKPIDACVSYYGVLAGATPDFSKLSGPVMGHYAEDDGWASPAVARALEKQIRDAGGHVEMYDYMGAKHAFMNPSPEVPKAGGQFNEEAAATSWARTLAFFKQHLW